ncbi:unnamed protein product, partial [Ectocarpus sp. 13 AM-2016]
MHTSFTNRTVAWSLSPIPSIHQQTHGAVDTHHDDISQINTTTAAAMEPITAPIVPLVALFVGSTIAFVAPTGRRASWSLANPQHAVRSFTSAGTQRHNTR